MNSEADRPHPHSSLQPPPHKLPSQALRYRPPAVSAVTTLENPDSPNLSMGEAKRWLVGQKGQPYKIPRSPN